MRVKQKNKDRLDAIKLKLKCKTYDDAITILFTGGGKIKVLSEELYAEYKKFEDAVAPFLIEEFGINGAEIYKSTLGLLNTFFSKTLPTSKIIPILDPIPIEILHEILNVDLFPIIKEKIKLLDNQTKERLNVLKKAERET